MRHFIDIDQLSRAELEDLLASAHAFKGGVSKPLLQGKFVANLFFEPSTRTRCSFEIAAKKLGADVINLDSHSSSHQKGETAIDTALNLKAMGVSIFIIRHKDNTMIETIADALGDDCAVINAGCGTKQHPSQALLDMFTINEHQQNFSDLTIAIIGDMHHSRVTHSDVAALQLLRVKKINLIAPENLLPHSINGSNVEKFTDLKAGLQNADVIITLRLQKERMANDHKLDEAAYIENFCLTPTNLTYAKPNAIVMHPGPMNRGIEISDAVADGIQSVILEQAANGVFARMALLKFVTSKKF